MVSLLQVIEFANTIWCLSFVIRNWVNENMASGDLIIAIDHEENTEVVRTMMLHYGVIIVVMDNKDVIIDTCYKLMNFDVFIEFISIMFLGLANVIDM